MAISGILKEDTDSQHCNKSFINQKKTIIMRTLNSNQVTGELKDTNGYIWNSKRRYR